MERVRRVDKRVYVCVCTLILYIGVWRVGALIDGSVGAGRIRPSVLCGD